MTPEYVDAEVISLLSLTAPAVRMVVVAVKLGQPDDPEKWAWHDIFPVVAIQATLVHHVRRPAGDPDVDVVEPAALGDISPPWVLEYSLVEQDPLIIDPDCGVMTAHDSLHAIGVAWRAVAAPWPPEEDEARLADEISEVEAEAVRNAEAMKPPGRDGEHEP